MKVNGVVQSRARGLEVRPGWIGLQSDGTPLEFRNVMLTPLGPSGETP